MKKLFLFICIILTSCAQVVQKIDTMATAPKSSKTKLHLVFSHNISGETHPCGCRQFPLGGLPQVYGLFQSLKESGELFYVDTGDTFFASSVIPKSMYDSLTYAANNLAVGLQMVGLNLYVPGDQDFARGIDFLKNIATIRKFDFLISNLKDESLLKHKRYAVLEREKAKIFFVGLVDPEAINSKESENFINPETAMTNVLAEIKNAGYDQNNPYHRLIVLSHAGIDSDEKFAAKFPQVDWIIGSHSQSFLRYSRDVGNVKMVQTLSKNHYVGEITIDLLAKKDVDSYYLHEIRDELVKKADPNPLVDFINAHKSKMSELQMKEQVLMTNDVSVVDRKVVKYKNPVSCIECHKPQVNFWQGTPHSIAYTTLMNTKEQNNLTCVKCHSLGLDDPKGFKNVKTLVQFKDRPIIDYWNKIHAESSKIKSVRKLSAEEIRSVSKKWMDLDTKMNVKNNFANVQCLNCHSLNNEHPFEMDEVSSNEKRETQIKNKCLTCHTPDQSPEWYLKNSKGISEGVNEKVINQNYKKVSCPLLQ